MLSDDRIRELYETARLDTDWLGRYQRLVARYAAMSDADLLLPENQVKLWRARDVTPMRRGKFVKVQQASQDAELARAFAALRMRNWPEGVEARAEAIQGEFERLLSLVTSRHSKNGKQPKAQLARAFAALLPADIHCVVEEGDARKVRELLARNPARFVCGHVLSRARLRAVLGPEANLDEHVKRSVFCWWLYENRATLTTGGKPKGSKAATALVLWPFAQQRKGLAAHSGLSERYRAVVQAAVEGAERAEILEALTATHPDRSERTHQQVVSAVKSLGLLESRDGLLYPSAQGREFLKSETPDVLVEALLVRVFPFAHFLRALAGGPKQAATLYAELQAIYPQWTSTQAASHSLLWARRVGLVERTPGGLTLTSYGHAWEKRLPPKLPVPEDEDVPDADPDEEGAALVVTERRAWPDFATIWERFGTDDDAKKLVFDEHQLAAIHAAWHCSPTKRFILLSGLSGTGKTQVASIYARLYCEHLDLDSKKHVALVPVSPDWRDPSGLLGYFSALHEEPSFHVEPALRLLMDASSDPGRPYFLILDEMNLARVERYFAPLLSAMETGGDIPIHGNADEIDGVPPRLKWPTNLFIAGTVNMDETTYPFSDKVLDRAFTFELWDVDLKSFFEKQEERDARVEEVLTGLYEILLPVRRHFGYRTAGEVLAFVKAAPEKHRETLLDQAVFSKVLPRIRGENGDGLQEALMKAETLCRNEQLHRSANKLAEMAKLLRHTGLTKFWA